MLELRAAEEKDLLEEARHAVTALATRATENRRQRTVLRPPACWERRDVGGGKVLVAMGLWLCSTAGEPQIEVRFEIDAKIIDDPVSRVSRELAAFEDDLHKWIFLFFYFSIF